MNAAQDTIPLSQLYWSPELWWIWAGVSFAFGLLFGSFFNVCIYRIPMGLSPNNPKRSFCFRCGSAIRWFDNLPVISYLLLRGKCRDCGAKYGPRYALVELLTGVLFLACFLVANPNPDHAFQVATFWYMAFAGLLVIGTFTDLDHWIIPDGITLGGGVAAVLASVVIGIFDQMPVLAKFGPLPVVRLLWEQGFFEVAMGLLQGAERSGILPSEILWWEPVANSILGAVFGMGLIYGISVAGRLAFGKEAMGLGDVKLFALVGGTLGIMGSMIALFLACVFGAFGGLAMVAAARLRAPSVPALAKGAPAEDLPDAPPPADAPWIARLSSAVRREHHGPTVHHLPFGPWIALGALVVLLFHETILRNLF